MSLQLIDRHFSSVCLRGQKKLSEQIKTLEPGKSISLSIFFPPNFPPPSLSSLPVHFLYFARIYFQTRLAVCSIPIGAGGGEVTPLEAVAATGGPSPPPAAHQATPGIPQHHQTCSIAKRKCQWHAILSYCIDTK